MSAGRKLLAWVMLAALSSSTVSAQRAARPLRPRQAQPRGQHAQLEQRLRQRLGAVVKQRLQLSDDQFRKLTETNRKYERQRRQLVQQERATRIGLRAEIAAGDHANQQHVAELMAQLVKLQQQRLGLLAEEQQDLSTFLTPVQRAQYVAIEERIRQRVEQMRQQQLDTAQQDTGRHPPKEPRR